MIARKSALIASAKILDGSLAYIALFFITRHMSPEDYGIVAFALGFAGLFSIFGTLGFNNAHIKKVSEGKELGTCIGTFLTTKILLTGLTVSLLIGTVFYWKFIMGRGFETPEHELAIYIVTGFWILKLIVDSFITTFSARKEIAKAQIPFLFGGFIRVSATIYVALAGFGALALAFTHVVGEATQLIVVLFLFRRYPIKKPSLEYFKEYSKFAFPLVMISVCSIIMTNIDRVLIQLFRSASDVGYYSSAFRLSAFINMFTLAIGGLLFPTFSMLHTNNNIAGIRKLVHKSERYLSMIVFPMVFGMVILAEPTIFILLSGWMPAVPILQILPFFVLFAALERPYQSQFLGMNQPKIARNRVLIMAFINVLLNIVLIPKDIQMLGGIKLAGMGATGAAIATVVSYGIGLIYSRAMAWKLNGVKGNPRIILHAIAAGAMAVIIHVILYGSNFIIYITRWYHLLIFSLFGLIIYISILFLLSEFTKDDFRFFIDALNIKKMLKYISDELRGK